ncbi:MAG: hypothetical protein WHS46_03235 [Desulfosoma sp.]
MNNVWITFRNLLTSPSVHAHVVQPFIAKEAQIRLRGYARVKDHRRLLVGQAQLP